MGKLLSDLAIHCSLLIIYALSNSSLHIQVEVPADRAEYETFAATNSAILLRPCRGLVFNYALIPATRLLEGFAQSVVFASRDQNETHIGTHRRQTIIVHGGCFRGLSSQS